MAAKSQYLRSSELVPLERLTKDLLIRAWRLISADLGRVCSILQYDYGRVGFRQTIGKNEAGGASSDNDEVIGRRDRRRVGSSSGETGRV